MEGEDRLLTWLRDRLRRSDPRGQAPDFLGDDTARLPATGSPLVLTVDSQIEGVHFPTALDERLLAPRLLEVNLSDLAASGARPRWALLALSTGPRFDHYRFFEAFLAACEERDVTLVGGDLASTSRTGGGGQTAAAPEAPAATVATLTLMGEAPPVPAGAEGSSLPLARSNGRPGDRLWVGGTLGESAVGCRLVGLGSRIADGEVVLPAAFESPAALASAARRAVRRHLQPRAQVSLGRALARRSRVAAMDLSDGLAKDLPRLCRESGVGAQVEADALPRPEGFSRLVEALAEAGRELGEEGGEPGLELMLGGGEDYVLLFSLPPGEGPPTGFPVTPIGELTTPESGEDGRILLHRRGRTTPMPVAGWDHLE